MILTAVVVAEAWNAEPRNATRVSLAGAETAGGHVELLFESHLLHELGRTVTSFFPGDWCTDAGAGRSWHRRWRRTERILRLERLVDILGGNSTITHESQCHSMEDPEGRGGAHYG